MSETKIALVTGANKGIGYAIASGLGALGYRVAVGTRDAGRRETAVEKLRAAGVDAFGVPLDVTGDQSVADAAEFLERAAGRLDVLVNNAGVNHRGVLSERSAAELTKILDTNLLAPVLLTHAALPHLREGSAIVHIASLAGKVPVPHEAAYSASKAGLRAFSRALGVELAARGVTVASVNPGPVDTGFFGDVSTVPDLVFSQPMSTAEQVAEGVMRAIDTGAAEVDVPAVSGKLATLGYLSPGLFARLRPVLEKRGARNKARYVARTKPT
jgi:short-subunit dehydrogenase